MTVYYSEQDVEEGSGRSGSQSGSGRRTSSAVLPAPSESERDLRVRRDRLIKGARVQNQWIDQ